MDRYGQLKYKDCLTIFAKWDIFVEIDWKCQLVNNFQNVSYDFWSGYEIEIVRA